MSPRSVLSVLALVVAVSLIGAPLTMHDWGEKAGIRAEPIENTSSVPEETPVLQYESLSPNAQQAIRVAIQRGGVTIYGTEDWPDEFAYTDVLRQYVVVYEGQPYRGTTAGGIGVGKDPVERTAFQLPFVGYGLFLLYVTRQTDRDDLSLRTPGSSPSEHPFTYSALSSTSGCSAPLDSPHSGLSDFSSSAGGQFVTHYRLPRR